MWPVQNFVIFHLFMAFGVRQVQHDYLSLMQESTAQQVLTDIWNNFSPEEKEELAEVLFACVETADTCDSEDSITSEIRNSIMSNMERDAQSTINSCYQNITELPSRTEVSILRSNSSNEGPPIYYTRAESTFQMSTTNCHGVSSTYIHRPRPIYPSGQVPCTQAQCPAYSISQLTSTLSSNNNIDQNLQTAPPSSYYVPPMIAGQPPNYWNVPTQQTTPQPQSYVLWTRLPNVTSQSSTAARVSQTQTQSQSQSQTQNRTPAPALLYTQSGTFPVYYWVTPTTTNQTTASNTTTLTPPVVTVTKPVVTVATASIPVTVTTSTEVLPTTAGNTTKVNAKTWFPRTPFEDNSNSSCLPQSDENYNNSDVHSSDIDRSENIIIDPVGLTNDINQELLNITRNQQNQQTQTNSGYFVETSNGKQSVKDKYTAPKKRWQRKTRERQIASNAADNSSTMSQQSSKNSQGNGTNPQGVGITEINIDLPDPVYRFNMSDGTIVEIRRNSTGTPPKYFNMPPPRNSTNNIIELEGQQAAGTSRGATSNTNGTMDCRLIINETIVYDESQKDDDNNDSTQKAHFAQIHFNRIYKK